MTAPSMAEYTPTTTEVRAAYVMGEHKVNPAFSTEETLRCFDRWLAAHDEALTTALTAPSHER